MKIKKKLISLEARNILLFQVFYSSVDSFPSTSTLYLTIERVSKFDKLNQFVFPPEEG